jgi:RNA-directed DNA polymerase
MKAVRRHTENPWVILYIERWPKAPMQMPNGTMVERTKGSPQGEGVSPMLVNLFLHYIFDKWIQRHHSDKPFARYADDAIADCHSKDATMELRCELEKRFTECSLELHPLKTRIVYCKDDNPRVHYSEAAFDFRGYTFRPRRAKNSRGQPFISFIPGVSNRLRKLCDKQFAVGAYN